MFLRLLLISISLWLPTSLVLGETVKIRVERFVVGANRPALSPMWFGFHEGSFDYFESGQVASDEIKAIAELGDAAPLRTLFSGSGVDVVVGESPLTPDNSFAEASIDLDPELHRHFTFASMVLPSNDTFYGNEDSRQLELFDADGTFLPQDFFLAKTDWWDAGSEINDKSATGGGAYIMGANPAEGADSRGVITPFAELSFYNGAILPNGEVFNTLTQATDEFEPMVRITMVPEPSAASLLLGLSMACFGRARRHRRMEWPEARLRQSNA